MLSRYFLRFVPASEEGDLSVGQDRQFNALEETTAFLGPDGGTVQKGTYEVRPDAPHGLLRLVTERACAHSCMALAQG